MEKVILKIKELDYRSTEAYNALRTNVEFSGNDIKVIGFTSSQQMEGKSSVTLQLACSFAQIGKNVLLIDADLRKSVLQNRCFEGHVKFGLTHYLVGKNTFEEVCCKTDCENFDIIFAGPVPPDPCKLFNGKKFQDIVNTATEKYDLVLIDTPPLGSVIDSAVIAKQCDGMIFVIEAGKISYRFAQKVKRQLEKTGCQILGTVLNKVDMKNLKYYGYYGNYYEK